MYCAVLLLISCVLSTKNDDSGSVFVRCEFSAVPTSEKDAKGTCMLTLAAPFHAERSVSMESCHDTPHFCAFVDSIEKPNAVSDCDGIITVNQAESNFDVQLTDPSGNVYTASGPLASWATWQVPRRTLLSGPRVAEGAEEKPHGSRRRLSFSSRFVAPYGHGRRSDCEQENCPKRWDSCWGETDELHQIQVLTFLERKFCDNFSTTDDYDCVLYVEGMFKDSNLVFESQLGIHLTLSYVITPDIVDKHFPILHNPSSLDGTQYLVALNEYYGKKYFDQSCATGYKFKNVTGYEYKEFGFAHVLTGNKLVMPSQTDLEMRGYAYTSQLCTCEAKAWTGYFGDLEDRLTWVTFAHEVGHLLGASHYWELKKLATCGDDKEAGLMDCGTGKVNDTYAFSLEHKNEMCSFLRRLKADPILNMHAGCLRPYFEPATLDPRFGPTYEAMAISMSLLVAVILIVLGGLLYVNQLRKRERWRYATLRAEIIRRRQIRKTKRQQGLNGGNSQQMLPSPRESVTSATSMGREEVLEGAPNAVSASQNLVGSSTLQAVGGKPTGGSYVLQLPNNSGPRPAPNVDDAGKRNAASQIPVSRASQLSRIMPTTGHSTTPRLEGGADSTVPSERLSGVASVNQESVNHVDKIMEKEDGAQKRVTPRPPPRGACPTRVAKVWERQDADVTGSSVRPVGSHTEPTLTI